MKKFTALENTIIVNPTDRMISYAGNVNTDSLSFCLSRYCDSIDLSTCTCTIKTKNSAGKHDVILPQVNVSDEQIDIVWTLTSASTSVAGPLLVQIQFEKGSDKSIEIVWQSNVMEFTVAESLTSADEVYEQNPSLFQQWENTITKVYQNTQTSAAQAAQSAQQANQHADRVQGLVSSFNGYTKQECDQRFALIGNASGISLTMTDLLPQAGFSSLAVSGQTHASSASPTPETPAQFGGLGASGSITLLLTPEGDDAHTLSVPVSQPLYALSNICVDQLDVATGIQTRRIGKLVLTGEEEWSKGNTALDTDNLITFYMKPDNAEYCGLCLCSHFPMVTDPHLQQEYAHMSGGLSNRTGSFFLKVARSRLETPDIAGIKAWLQANPITILYELKETVNVQQSVTPIKPLTASMTITEENGASLSAVYYRDINIAFTQLAEAIANQ